MKWCRSYDSSNLEEDHPEYPDVLTVKDVMEYLYIGKNKVYQLLSSGELKGFKIGHDWRITRASIEYFIKINEDKNMVKKLNPYDIFARENITYSFS